MLTDASANALLDGLLGTVGVLPATIYIGLLKAAPLPNGTGVVEQSGNGYARVAVSNNSTQWPAAASRQKTHSADITFPTATGTGWGTVTHVGVFDASSGGNLKLYDVLAIPRTVVATDVFRFLAGSANALKFMA
jgi:hypothetical protein